jgi:RNA polymerase sigma factor (sigma-70 family)
MDTFTDASLIARVLVDDDRNAFGELVRRYQSDVRALLRKLTNGNIDAADDLAQETFIRAYRHLRTFKGGAIFATWLYRIACNVFLSSVKDVREEVTDAIDEYPEESGDREDAALARFDLQKAMTVLSGGERAALVLFYSKGMTHEEVAQTMNTPLGTIKTLILRGKEKLKKKLTALERQVSI